MMKKADIFLVLFLMAVCVGLLIPLFNGSLQPDTAVVRVRNEEVMRLDLSRDGTYTVAGTLGDVHIEVRNQAIAVTQENSPHHYCSRQGYVSSSVTPIVCLPNDTVITIEKSEEDSQEDTVIQ